MTSKDKLGCFSNSNRRLGSDSNNRRSGNKENGNGRKEKGRSKKKLLA